MDTIYLFCEKYLQAFSSPFFLIFALIIITISNKPKLDATESLIEKKHGIIINISIFFLLFYTVYLLASQNIHVNKWLSRLNNPIITSLNIIVLPAVFLPRNKWYKSFLLIPCFFILAAISELLTQYYTMPPPRTFMWFLMRPEYLVASVISGLVITQYFVNLNLFRKIVRVTMLVVLVYGGFVFRQSYADYTEMLERRKIEKKDIIELSDTTPVMQYDNKLTYIPAAPCRFSADGGYVQGCVMELLQRFMQVNLIKVKQGDKEEIALLAIGLAAILSMLILLYVGARWWCGWICPLSTLGDFFDFLRRFFKLPHLKLNHIAKHTYLYSGIGLGSLGLLFAKGYAHVNEQGMFLGCKIPLYPFCKICPGQQVCPVAAQGPSGYPPLAGTEWLLGFLKIFALILIVVFVISFIAARRLWCYFCPMGLIGGIFNKNSLLALKKNAQKCNGRGTCNDVCPMDIHRVQKEMKKKDVTSFNCVFCLNCVDKCPQDGCLSFQFAHKKIVESELK